MNILVINAFGTSPKASQRFDSFCRLLKNIFKKISKGSGIETFNFICRSPNNISEFLYKYDMISGDVNQNKRNKKNFDKIDIVIIDGYEKYVPWDQRSYILCEFIKLCKITNKILYAGGVGFEILMYYLATGSLNEFNFVNAKGQIKSIEEMSKAPKKFVKELKSNDIFLDFVTGDILEYKSDEQWAPIKNIGMHKQMTAEKYFNRGKFVLKESFRGKDYIKNENSYTTVCDEIKVKLTRQYFHHPLFQNLPLEFVATTSMTWFPHFFNVLNQTLQFKILCECDKGPVVIEHKNSTGVLFHIIDKYRDSVLFMENFIKAKFNEIQNKIFKFKHLEDEFTSKDDKNEIPAIFRYYISSINFKKNNKNQENVKNTNLDKVMNSLAFSRIKNIKNEANHVGFSINNRDRIFVENNYINQSPIVSTKRNKHIIFFESDEDNKLNNDNILTPKIMTRKSFAKFDKQINSGRSFKNIYKIKHDKDTSLINHMIKSNRNPMDSFDKKNLNKNKMNNIFLSNRNQKKLKYRIKSASLTNKTVFNNRNERNSFLKDNTLKESFPISLKREPKDNNEEEFNDIYVPKYPRLADRSTRNNDIKGPYFGMYNDNLNKNENNKINFFNLGLLPKKKVFTINKKN